MQPLLAEIRTDVLVRDERSAARRTLRLEVAASRPDGATSALIHNLSESGLLIETSANFQSGEALQVELPHAGMTTAYVVWARGRLIGCEFASPVSRAAVSAALLLAPVQHAKPFDAFPPVAPASASDHFFEEEQAETNQVVIVTSLILSLLVALAIVIALLRFPFST